MVKGRLETKMQKEGQEGEEAPEPQGPASPKKESLMNSLCMLVSNLYFRKFELGDYRDDFGKTLREIRGY